MAVGNQTLSSIPIPGRPQVGQAAGYLVLAIAAAALMGWLTGRPLLASWVPGPATLKPVTALCLIAIGICLARARPAPFADIATGLAIAAVGLLNIGQDILGVEIGLERLLAPLAPPARAAGMMRMAGATALAMIAAGASLVLARMERHRRVAALLALLAGGIGALALFAQLTGAALLLGAAPFRTLALPTSLAIIAVAVGLLARGGVRLYPGTPRPLLHYLVLLGLAILAPLLLLGSYAAWRIEEAQETARRTQLLQAARSISATVDREMQSEIENLTALAASQALAAGDYEAVYRQAQAILGVRDAGAILLVDGSRREIFNTLVPFGAPTPQADPSGVIRRAIETGRLQFSSLFRGEVSKRLTIDVALPVATDGLVRHVLVRSPQVPALARVLYEYALPDGWRSGLSDANGILIARSMLHDAYVGRPIAAPARKGPGDSEGVLETIDLEGQPSLHAYHWSDLTGWRTAVWGHKAAIEAPTRLMWRSLLLLSLVALATVAGAALGLTRLMTRSIGVPQRLALALADGPAAAPPPTPLVEANRLSEALIDASERRRHAEAARNEALRLIEGVMSLAPVSIYIHNVATRSNELVSPQAGQMLGYTAEEWQDKIGAVLDLMHPDDAARLPGHFAALEGHAGSNPIEFEYRMRHADGSWRWFLSRDLVFERDADGRILKVLGTATDITDLKRQAEELRGSEARYRAAFDVANVGKMEVDATTGRFLLVNDAYCDIVGWSRGELLHMGPSDLVHPDDRAADAPALAEFFSGATERYSAEKRFVRKDGGTVWVRVNCGLVRNADGTPRHSVGVLENITLRKAAETELRASEERLRLASEAAGFGVHDFDVARQEGTWTDGMRRILGIPGEGRVPIDTTLSITHADDRERVRGEMRAIMRRPGPYEIEARIVRPDGSVRSVLDRGEAIGPVDPATGRVARVIGTLVDVTERRQRESALRESERRLAAVLEALPIGVALIGRDGRALVGNEVYKRYVPRTAAFLDEERHGLWEGYRSDGSRIERLDYPAARALRGERVWPGLEFLYHGDLQRGPVWTRVAALPLRDDKGEVIGATAVIVDIDREKRALDDLRDSEERYRLALQAGGFGTWELDLANRTRRWTPEGLALVGLDLPSGIGQYLGEGDELRRIVHPDDIHQLGRNMMLSRSSDSFPIEYRIVRPDGGVRWISGRGMVVRRDAAGRPLRSIYVAADVTERKRAEQELEESHRRLRDRESELARAHRIARLGSFEVDLRGGTFINRRSPEYLRIHGLPPEDWNEPHEAWVNRMHPDDRVTAETAFKRAVEEGAREYDNEYRIIRPNDGEVRWIRVLAEIDRDEKGHPIRLFGTHVDITERRKIEQELRDREEHLRLVLGAAKANSYAWDIVHDRIVRLFSSEPALPETGAGTDTFARVVARVHADDRDLFRANVDAAMDVGDYNSEHRVVRPDGSVAWLLERGRVDRDGAGRPLRLRGINIDITERKQAEEALAESEATFRAMFSVSSVGKVHVDSQTGRFLRVNEAMCLLTGYSEAELLVRTFLDITHPDERERDGAAVRRLYEGQATAYDIEKRFVRKDGSIVWARVTANAIHDRSGRPRRNTAVIQDITARKRIEAELRQRDQRFRAAEEITSAFAYDWNIAEGGLWRSEGFTRVVGWQQGEVARTPQAWLDLVHPADRGGLAGLVPDRIADKDGRFTLEYRVKHKDGHYVWLWDRGQVERGPDGSPVRVIGAAVDITERKGHEEQVRMLMREVNHRSKNMLAVVQAIARQTAAGNPREFVARFSNRIQALSASQDLLVKSQWQGVGFEELVRAQLAHLADLIGNRITIAGPPLQLKPAAAQAIGLALHELATNAGKHGALSSSAGTVEIAWSLEGGSLLVGWTERGGPPVVQPRRHGFGTTVLSSMVAMSVDGKVDLAFARAGLEWRLTCPAEKSLEPSPAGGQAQSCSNGMGEWTK